MKPQLFIASAAVCLLPLISTLHASENLGLESALYVFKQGDFHEVIIPGATTVGGSQVQVFQAPASARFDQLTLSLEGSQARWGDGSSPPEQFSLIAAPPLIRLTPGQPVTITSSTAIQYLERLADDKLQVREIPAESPDAPHLHLSFTANAGDNPTEGFSLTCDLDIATVRDRKSIPGVALEVGQPRIARFKENLTIPLHPGQWAGLLVKAPNGSDYSLLLLLRLGQAPSPPPGLAKITSDPARVEVAGYSVQDLGPRWRQKKSDIGVTFANVSNNIGFFGAWGRPAFKRAGFSVVPIAAVTDRPAFLRFIKKMVEGGSDTDSFQRVKKDFKEKERDGLWLVECRFDLYFWHYAVDMRDGEAKHIANLFALDPNNPEQLISVWYGWQGINFDEGRFEAEARQFFDSLQKSKK
jgi:hypothetical protein